VNFVTKSSGLWYNVVCYVSSTSVMEKHTACSVQGHSTYFPKSCLRMEQNTERQALGDPCTLTKIDLLCSPDGSFCQRSRTSSKVQYLADRPVFKVTWFQGQPRCLNLNTVTQNMWSCFRGLLASTAPHIVYQHQFKCMFFEMTVSC
jgi:hypothetical protein